MRKYITLVICVLMAILTGCVHDVAFSPDSDGEMVPSNEPEPVQADDAIEEIDESNPAQADETVDSTVQLLKAAYSSRDKDWYIESWVTVKIENTSDKPIDSLELKVTTYDESDHLVEVFGESSVLLRLLLNGELVSRKACSYDVELPNYNKSDIDNAPCYMELRVYRCGFTDGSSWRSKDDGDSLRIECNDGWLSNESMEETIEVGNNDKDEVLSKEDHDDKTIAENFLYAWFDDEGGMMNENPITAFDRIESYVEPESDAYADFYDAQNNVNSPFYKDVSTYVVGKPTTIEESGDTYRVEIEYSVMQNVVDQKAYDRLLQHKNTEVFDITVENGKVVSVQRV